MAYYITYGEFQSQMKSYYERTGRRLQFTEMSELLYRKGLLMDSCALPELSNDYDNMSDEEFEKLVDKIPLLLSPYIHNTTTENILEADIFPTKRDVFVIRHPRYTRNELHKHNYFEVNFVAKGQGKFYFESEERILHEGEICIIAPSSKHDFQIDDESTVYTICIRQSTFNTTFFSLMSRKDLLSYFFRTILLGNEHSNYLLFFTKHNILLKKYIRHMIIESNIDDIYGNSCCISYVNLFFSTVLRSYSETIQFYNYQMGTDFSLVLQYIQHNYQTLTLASLSELFHYSEPHLCTLIKQNTGYTFTELIKCMRLSDAANYLSNTNLKIGEIAQQVGYNSADHFSRVFRSTYNMSPNEYRRQNQHPETAFVPFAIS
jgi:AraC-like DNA-binding protein/quercetin dioxygenase-like cupin family protein